MKTIKIVLAFALAAFFAKSAHADLITASSSGVAEPDATLTYTYPTEDGPGYDQLYFTSYSFSAWYDTATGEGHYEYTVNGYTSLTIELEATGGTWSQASYYGEGFTPYFAFGFWWQVYGF